LEFAQASHLEVFEMIIFVMVNNCLGSLESFGLGFVIAFLFFVALAVFDFGLDLLCFKGFTRLELLSYLSKIFFCLRCFKQLVFD
jgi:hypothetical protein